MKIKKYTSKTMREALLKIKQELGEEAIILKTRKLPKKLFSLQSQDEIEVTAAIDETVTTENATPLKYSQTGLYRRTGKVASPVGAGASQNPRPLEPAIPIREKKVPEPPQERRFRSPDSNTGETFRYMELKEDLYELKDMIKSILSTGETAAAGGFVGGWAILYKRLVDSEVKQQVAADLIAGIQKKKETLSSESEKEFVEVLSDYFPVSGPIRLPKNRPYVVAFVGPTGTGKTTTLAKLAAHLAVNKNKMVSLITADTYRIAAIDQIRTFADIVNIGLQVVFSPDDIPEALSSCENDDIIFVDTAGRSQSNEKFMTDLETFLAKLGADETHLVLSATTKDSDLNHVIGRYKGFGINRLIFTKLDETQCLGNVFNVATQNGIPVSYFTTGQSIPDDIELAQPGRFIQRLWERRTAW